MKRRHDDGRTARGDRMGFTLVELLVVITIIGMLMALLFPVMGTVLESGRRTQCINHQAEIAKAVQQFEGAKGHYPGYRWMMLVRRGGETGSPSPQEMSWVAAVLEYLKKAEYESLRKGQSTTNSHLPTFLCPSDPQQQTDNSISYAVNCGRQDKGASQSNPPDWPANGVFLRLGNQQQGRYVTMKQEMLTDGADRTIMLSENIQTTRWSDLEEAAIGIVWHHDQSSPNFPTPESRRINKGKDDVPLTSEPINYARPSSNHPKGVVVAYCDGNAKMLSEDVAYADVYCKLMTSDGANAMEPGGSQKNRQTKLDETLVVAP